MTKGHDRHSNGCKNIVKSRSEATVDPLTMRGIITVLNTPFTIQNELDEASLRRNVRLALDAGVVGFLVPGLAAELYHLTPEERLRMTQVVVEEAGGRVPVIGGATAASPVERLKYAEQFIGLGCAGILVNIPYQDDGQYERDVREIAGVNPDFLMLQDWDHSGFGVPVPLIAKLFREIESFRSYKIEVVPAGVKYSQVLEATGGDLHVAGGWAVTQFIEGLDRGIHAFMPTGMHEGLSFAMRTYKTIFMLLLGSRFP
ncbi:dihydrodipicolinate synthase family protein [Paenibacillus sp. Soil724D2]|uniref:dihydrodipicolinate synthase family protein n=1 Tax=Paenibacillus sp. (strain Soil724D2) TaxID=1736392 RepID=UPI0009E7139A|nr:dihydrodipicolinate synthase family protein [Paenibacillus sp. Soil724D2]